MKLRNFVAWVTASVATCLSGAATAQSGFYLGGALGQSDMKQRCDGLPAGISCKKTDTAFKVFGGYQVTRNWGIEAEYADFGKTTASGTFLGLPVTAEAKVSGFGIAGTATWPLSDQFDVFAKLGLFHGTVKSSATVGGVSASLSGTSDKEMFGVGAAWNFSPNWAARLEWERFDKVGNDTTGTSDVDLFSIGVAYRF